MKKFFSVALVAMMTLTVFSFVSCNKGNQPEPPVETPKVLTGTSWVNGAGSDWVTTLVFETENEGVRKVDNQYGHSESDITYTYADGEGIFIFNDEEYDFTVEGNKLIVPDKQDPNPDFAEVYILTLK